MRFTDFFIRRPAFTIVLISIISIIGLISFKNLPIRWVPNISYPHVSIFTSYSGASASLVENQITTPIEAALSGIDGVEELKSHSSQGQSSINLEFKLGRNMDAVVDDVRGALARVTGSLPRDADAPIVSKAQSNAMAIIYFAFSDKRRSQKEVSDYLQQFVIPRLQTVDGVALVTTFGRQVSAMRIWLDPNKMTSSGVTVEDVIRALQDQNIQIPGGTIRGKDRYYTVVTNENLKSADEFNNLIIRNTQNQIIRLKNVGTASIGPADPDTGFRVMGQPAVALGIVPQSTANPLEVAKQVKKVFSEVTSDLPAGMQGTIVYDETTFIHDSIHSVYDAVFEAIIFVLIVILFFLGNLRATFIPVITIPVCLITTFAILNVFNFTINTISLMAFVLAIGLVVDDAIVMLENIVRHIENGMQPFDAAIKGAREIIFPIIAMTLTLAAVYTPIAFTGGMLGAIFCEFALTLAGAVIISGIVALTLSPMMCARLLKTEIVPSPYSTFLTKTLLRLQHVYLLSIVMLIKVLKNGIRFCKGISVGLINLNSGKLFANNR